MAIDSKGTYPALPSKILRLQDNPITLLLVAGGIDHWVFVRDRMTQQRNTDELCREIARLLDEEMTEMNQAYGRVYCFENQQPVRYRIDRPLGAMATMWSKGPLLDIDTLGHPIHAEAARRFATVAVLNGVDCASALRWAIMSRMPDPDLADPIAEATITLNG
jgi:hypothetical protein